MSERCASCGRKRIDDDADTTYAEIGDDRSWQLAWANFDGRDLCPSCQTAEQRASVVQRLFTGVEREIARRQASGEPPDEYESGLVEFAMELRTSPSRQAGDPEERAVLDVERSSERLSMSVAVTGAFLTGHPLAVSLHEYSKLQTSLARSLNRPKWRVGDSSARGGTYASGGGFAEDVPLVIARREGADMRPWLDEALAAALPLTGPDHELAELDLEAQVDRLIVDVYDLGVAVMTAWIDFTVGGRPRLDVVARRIKQLVILRASDDEQPLSAALQQVALATNAEYAAAVASLEPEMAEVAWLWRPHGDRHTLSAAPDEGGRLLWLHPVHVVCAVDDRELVAAQLAPVHQRTIAIDRGVFAAGIGWSAIAVAGRADASTSLRLTQLHWAYYALYMVMDRGLLEILTAPRWRKSAKVRQLETEAQVVFRDYLRVMDTRARLDSHLSGLGGDELAIWNTISEAQGFDTVYQGVERKLDALATVATQRVDAAAADRTRRIGKVLGFLTLLTVVTVVGGLISVLFGSREVDDASFTQRSIAVGIALVVACVIYWLVFVRTSGPADLDGRRTIRRWQPRRRP